MKYLPLDFKQQSINQSDATSFYSACYFVASEFSNLNPVIAQIVKSQNPCLWKAVVGFIFILKSA